MNTKPAYFELDHGNIQGWVEQESSVHLKATNRGDPVELTLPELRQLIEHLNRLAETLANHEQ